MGEGASRWGLHLPSPAAGLGGELGGPRAPGYSQPPNRGCTQEGGSGVHVGQGWPRALGRARFCSATHTHTRRRDPAPRLGVGTPSSFVPLSPLSSAALV